MIYNKNITKAKKEKNDWWGEGGHSLHFRHYMLIPFLIIFYFTLSRLKGTLKFVLTYIICSVSLSKTYREKMISRTLYLLKKSYWFLLKCSLGIKMIYDWVKSALNKDVFFFHCTKEPVVCLYWVTSLILHDMSPMFFSNRIILRVSTCTNTWISFILLSVIWYRYAIGYCWL